MQVVTPLVLRLKVLSESQITSLFSTENKGITMLNLIIKDASKSGFKISSSELFEFSRKIKGIIGFCFDLLAALSVGLRHPRSSLRYLSAGSKIKNEPNPICNNSFTRSTAHSILV